ncbi:hypothetical protein IW967_00225 [Alicyclobacillus mali]|uniref:Uncharacterized protein n=1 Tax=Alicyclobacillus mali (ex Roth et al. 2021) TaxID=1123961 RepID=A0ABS0EYE6_9BACL|nr:hypothetical protein [Alicyclobacillus mali (ex Roth et al. 2021)]MBF8376323.1 hypothetical protein [Alicyclobacillus mali (ex Roth et al. 2021)]MCL6488833.1 hypothetical protein [Alicyclobacillus mali (ex Roth et al. 2021)]
MVKSWKTVGLWVWYVFWALFANAVYVWILRPLVDDLALYGVLAVIAIILLWMTSLKRPIRRRWLMYTLFVLIVAEGYSTLAFASKLKQALVAIVMLVLLWLLAMLIGRVRPVASLLGGASVLIAQVFLPLNDWAFLTHFRVLQDAQVNLRVQNSPEAPFAVIPVKGGQAIITIDSHIPTKQELEQRAISATDSPDALYNVLQTAQGEYEIVELKSVGGHLKKVVPSPQDLARVNPLDLVRAFFPYELANWYVENGRVYEYLTPFLTDQQAVEAALDPASYPASFQAIANQASAKEVANWDDCLAQLGVKPDRSGVYISNDRLMGLGAARGSAVTMQAESVVGEGHFTTAQDNQILLVGDNSLHVYDVNLGRIVASYQGSADNPVPNDIRIGPLVSGGRDAVFVNASPAYILTVSPQGTWKRVYTAPSQSFRFETVLTGVRLYPEILTNDPSYIRNSPVRYFSAYRFVPSADGDGQLVRVWRVFRTNVVNVTPLHLQGVPSEVLALDIYGTGDYLIIAPSNTPVLPAACAALAAIIVGGWLYRPRRNEEEGSR